MAVSIGGFGCTSTLAGDGKHGCPFMTQRISIISFVETHPALPLYLRLTDGCMDPTAVYSRQPCEELAPWQAALYTTAAAQTIVGALGVCLLLTALTAPSRHHTLTAILGWAAWLLTVHLHHRTDAVNTLKDKLYRWLLLWLACCLSNRVITRWQPVLPILATFQLTWVYLALNIVRLQAPSSTWRDGTAVCVLQAAHRAEHGTAVLASQLGASAVGWTEYSQSPDGCRLLTILFPTLELAGALLLLASLFLAPLRKVAHNHVRG